VLARFPAGAYRRRCRWHAWALARLHGALRWSIDADGQAEALLVVSCLTPAGRKNPPSIVLLIGANPVHTMALAFTSSPRIGDGEGRSYVSATVIQSDGAISYLIRTFEGNGQCQYHQRWTGTGLAGECAP